MSSASRTEAAPALPGYLALVAFAAVYVGIWSEWGVPAWVAAVYVGVSVCTFVAYALDKRAARRGAYRVSENTLHLLALAGGWPGAIVAQQSLRHKTVKRSFRVVFWLTVVANTVAFVALTTPIVRTLAA